MSADSIDLDGLERKDRAELATIAQALGGKPPSRAKKADIITLILELAGVTGSASGDSPTGTAETRRASSPSGAPASDDATAGGHASDGTSSEDSRSDDSTSTSPADASPAEASTGSDGGAVAADESAARGGRARGRAPQRVSGGPSDAPADSGRPSREGSAPASVGRGGARTSDPGRDAAPSGRGQGGPSHGGESTDQANGKSGNQQGNSGNAQGGDNGGRDTEVEPGNQSSDDANGDAANGEGEGRRRRRRRGRDRDRTDESAEGTQQWEGELVEASGVLDLRDEGYGFLRVNGLLPSRDDVYVSVKQTRQFGLRRGDWLTGASRPANRGEKNPALLRIDRVNDLEPERSRERPAFEDLTPLFPTEQLRLEREDHPYDMASRIIDLIAPIGKGQRGLIVSPPKAGKTTIMKTIAQAIEENHPEVELMVLLVDERPEEVTDMRRSIKGEVVASTFDRPAEEHTQVAELAIERAKRMVEQGSDVVVILDGITRLARAYNLAAPNGGRIMSGGLDTGALYPPKRFFGAARNIEDGGSLTILATALVDTNSKMDEVIFEEFKGTGNMELRLDRRAAEQRVYPAIDVDASSTRHEELLIDPDRLQQVWKLRRLLSALAAQGEPAAGLELVVDRMRKFPTNDVFLKEIAKGPAVS